MVSPGGRIAILALGIAVSQMATSLYLPSLPAMAAELRLTPSAASLTLTAFYVGFALCCLLAGPMADAWGRRPILIGGLGVYLAGTILCAVAPSILMFLAGRVLQAAGASAAPVVGRAMLRDVQGADGGTRAIIWLGIAMAGSPALGPPLGGLILQALGWRATFWVLALIAAALMLLVFLLLDETLSLAARVKTNWPGLARRYRALLNDRVYCLNVGAVSALFGGLGVFFATGPFIFIQLMGYTPVAYGVLNLANVAGYLVGSAIAGRLAKRLPPPTLVKTGSLLALIGGVAMVVLAAAGVLQAWAVLGPVVVLTIGFGIVLPAGTAGALNRHPGQAGLASALLGFIQIGAAAAGSAVAGATLGWGGTLPVACVFLLLTLLAALFAKGLRAPAAA